MASKKKTPTAAGLQTLKIGSRVRRTDDGVEGRIVWANGVSVKITWDDGEQVTWRRDSLAGRPIEILAGRRGVQPAPPAALEPTEPAAAETPPAAPESAQEPPAAATPTSEPTTVETPPAAAETATARSRRPRRRTTAAEASRAPDAGADGRQAEAAAKTAAEPQEKKLSALDAAAKVLGEAGQPMGCKELIAAMAAKGYWTSPGGKTPEATLYSALLREITVKGDQARFVKAEPRQVRPPRGGVARPATGSPTRPPARGPRPRWRPTGQTGGVGPMCAGLDDLAANEPTALDGRLTRRSCPVPGGLGAASHGAAEQPRRVPAP